MVYDERRGQLVAFGGSLAGTWYTDTWVRGLAAAAAEYGSGCSGTMGVPKIVTLGLPHLGSADFVIRLEDVRPRSACALALATSAAAVPIGPCTLLVPTDQVVVVGMADGGGSHDFSVPIGRPPQWSVGDVFAQGFSLDPNGALGGLASFTPGLRLFVAD